MGTSKRHPLYIKADAVKQAFVLNGFTLHDDGLLPELEASDWNLCAFKKPEQIRCKPILLEDETYALRSELITAQLNDLKAPLPIRTITCGRVYDGNDSEYPNHTVIEGVVASADITKKGYAHIWDTLVKQLYGISAKATLNQADGDTYRVDVKIRDDSDAFTFAYTGEATVIAKTLLGTCDDHVHTWIFTIDIDALAIHDFKLEDRSALYNPCSSFLAKYDCDAPAFGDTFMSKAGNLLRSYGFAEFSGMKIYEADCYKKMNMIQESWDTNNKGVQLTTPLGTRTGLPTVLAPALEEALAANYKAGEESAKIFEFAHIFQPGKNGKKPAEKLSLSFGAYGPDLDKIAFRKLVDQFLTEVGISNHFFIPTDMAIAYDTSDCRLVLDEKMSYLAGNFGTISPKARENHGIGVTAYMCQFELEPIEAKAAEEFAFVPTELSD